MKELKVIKKQLGYIETLEFVDSVVDAVIDVEEDRYSPELYYVFLQKQFAVFYTDYEPTEDLEANFARYIGIKIEDMLPLINEKQFHELEDAIHNKIEFNKQKLIHKKSDKFDSLLSSISSLVNIVNTKIDETDFTNLGGLNKLGEKLENIPQEDILKALAKEMKKGRKSK